VSEATASTVTQDAPDPTARAKALLRSGDLASALEVVDGHLGEQPSDSEALYVRAVVLRYQQQTLDALETLSRLHALRPAHARGYQEAGHNQRTLSVPAAIASYEQAVALNPELLASWSALVGLHAKNGDYEAAAAAKQEVERLGQWPPELVSASSLMHDGKLWKAEQLARAFLQRNGHHVEAMRLLAALGLRAQVLDDAEFLLESCLVLEPDHRLARYDYVDVLQKRQKFERALEEAKKLRELEPDNAAFEITYANQTMAAGDFDSAIAHYDAVLERFPNAPQVSLMRGHALKTVGRSGEAVAAYQRAADAKPDFGDAYWSLANLKTYRFERSEISRMREHEAADSTSLVDRIHLCFALGKALEDAGQFDEAFEAYERGNRLKKAELRYDADRMDVELRAQHRVCTAGLFERHADGGCPDPAPIFIVGLPRAGSTLLEQVLASHSQVDGTLELPNVLALAHRLNGRQRSTDEPRYPRILHELPTDKLRSFGEAFIEDTRIHRRGAAFFTDKMPNNFRHMGLIHLMLPNARIIDARRDPMACCFSGFKQLFGEGQEFSYGLEEIGRYYRGYVDLMEHWEHLMPAKILRVQYEEVVADLEGQVRRLLDFLGLPFEEECLAFHRTERSVRTASSEQVRQPIYREGLEQWRHFDAHLDPLRGALAARVGGER
jgi:tetratricopeptide (TPR) repeat protein